ncbi:minor capsid protein [Photobacterium ganghwense]|uniref:minor capsid protein n=1 Tax=Photobacterium ganghwense TaxID=320778 RepID=UPI001A8E6484|nr:minor capsid protein [Photobacterium ganghwense]QSV17182.1 hypothetical protein FH974_19785 [Photobacterium ganghwense]
MILESYAHYLDYIGVGVIGETLFAYEMPSDVVSGILLAAPYGGFKIDHELKGYYKDVLRLVVHSDSIADGVSLVDQIFEYAGAENVTSGNVHFNYVRPITYPEPHRQDETGRYEFVMVMEFSCVKL